MPARRIFFLGMVFTLALSALACSAMAHPGTERLTLWPGTPPGGGGPTGPIRRNARGAIRNVAVPALEIFRPEKPNGAAMLIAGGGGYRRIERGNEADPAAQWLVSRGITAFVLSYRLPPEGWKAGPLAPLQDAQRAIRLIRAEAPRYRLDPSRVGVLGFSAGGHLMGLAATRSAFASYEPVDAIDRLSARPDAAALIYPIITVQPPYDRSATRLSLIGAHPAKWESAQWSVQTFLRPGTPPIFLVQAEDDPISDPANTLIMAEFCRRVQVPVELHRLAEGGHGFGMGRAGSPSAEWPVWFETWLRHDRMMAPD